MEGSLRRAEPDPGPASPRELAALPPLVWPEGGRVIHVPALPGRPTVLLLHGWVMNRSAWATAAFPLLAGGVGLLMPDLPGHGDAKPLPSSVKPRAFFPTIARRLVAGLDALGIERVSLAGYSMGAAAALCLLDEAPSRVDRLFLLCPLVGASTSQIIHNRWASFSRLVGNVRRALSGPHGGALWRVAPGLGVSSLPAPDRVVQHTAEVFADGSWLPQESRFDTYVDASPEATELEVFLEGLRRTDLRTTLRSLRASRTVSAAGPLGEWRGEIKLATGSLDALSPPGFVRRIAGAVHPTRRAEAAAVSILEGVDHVALSQAPHEVTRLLFEWLGEPSQAPSTSQPAASGKVSP